MEMKLEKDRLSINYNDTHNTESYSIDFNKVKTVEDCVLLIEALIRGYSGGYKPDIIVTSESYLYEPMKHLAKEM